MEFMIFLYFSIVSNDWYFKLSILLTLAEEEFIHRKKDLSYKLQKLISNKWVNLIIKIFIHIKVIFDNTNNDIPTADDDIIGNLNFIQIFIEEHKIIINCIENRYILINIIVHSNDIICRSFMYFVDNKLELKKLIGYKG